MHNCEPNYGTLREVYFSATRGKHWTMSFFLCRTIYILQESARESVICSRISTNSTSWLCTQQTGGQFTLQRGLISCSWDIYIYIFVPSSKLVCCAGRREREPECSSRAWPINFLPLKELMSQVAQFTVQLLRCSKCAKWWTALFMWPTPSLAEVR